MHLWNSAAMYSVMLNTHKKGHALFNSKWERLYSVAKILAMANRFPAAALHSLNQMLTLPYIPVAVVAGHKAAVTSKASFTVHASNSLLFEFLQGGNVYNKGNTLIGADNSPG